MARETPDSQPVHRGWLHRKAFLLSLREVDSEKGSGQVRPVKSSRTAQGQRVDLQEPETIHMYWQAACYRQVEWEMKGSTGLKGQENIPKGTGQEGTSLPANLSGESEKWMR